MKKYDFLRSDENYIHQHTKKELLNFYRSVDTLVRSGNRQVNIIHIGDSHVQAGFFPNSVRTKLQSHLYFGNAGRGFIFPYRMAQTNNPSNYRVYFTGSWEHCKHVQRNKSCDYGLSGITVNTADTTATVQILQNFGLEKPEYRITKLKVFHKRGAGSFDIELANGENAIKKEYDLYTEFILSEELDTIELVLEKRHPQQQFFELYGFSLETDYPGLVYSSVGVNGADLSAYLRCDLLGPQLAVLKPDLVIISLGANDAYPKVFNAEEYKQNYKRLIETIRTAVPGVNILITTPGDGYRYKKYLNYNYVKTREVILELAKEKDVAVWDFYSVMGGANSIYKWYKAGLAQHDKLHLTQAGYDLQGELLHDALVRAYYDYLDIYLKK